MEIAKDSIQQVDSLRGVLEIDNIDFFIKPIQENLFNTEYVERSLIFGGVILIAIVIIWLIDKMITWSVNNNTETDKKKNNIPFFLFPTFFLAMFIVDYISVIFNIFNYPWLSFGVLIIEASYFISTTFWAMRIFNVPIVKIFSFLFTIIKAWRTKDIEILRKSIDDLNKQENKSNIGKKSTIILLLFLFVSCLTQKRVVQDFKIYKSTEDTEIKVDTVKTIKRVYVNAFDSKYLVNKSNNLRRQKSLQPKAKEIKVPVSNTFADNVTEHNDIIIEEDNIQKPIEIPVYYKGVRIGTFRSKSNR